MKFTDYTPEELVGMPVLHSAGFSGKIKSIKYITKVNKVTFAVSEMNVLYNLSDGRRRGGGSYGFGKCELLTPEKAEATKRLWRFAKEHKKRHEEVTSFVQSVKSDAGAIKIMHDTMIDIKKETK